MQETKTLKVGDIAPDFSLCDHHDRQFRLQDLKGKKVLLSFHPLAWTRVCSQQMKDLEAARATLESLNAVAVGLSVDTVPSKHAWARELGLKETRLLSDFWPHGGVAHALGIFREEEGFSERANILIDEQGLVAFIRIYPIEERPDLGEVLAAMKV
jgi:peroxiredoxin